MIFFQLILVPGLSPSTASMPVVTVTLNTTIQKMFESLRNETQYYNSMTSMCAHTLLP
jgi:hypothetical protein